MAELLDSAAAAAPDPRFVPFTGREYLDSLDDGREVWIYGERVKKITEHPAFRNSARMVARCMTHCTIPAASRC